MWHVMWSVLKHYATGQLVHCTVSRDMERLETLCHWSASAFTVAGDMERLEALCNWSASLLYLTDNCHLPHSSSLIEAIGIVTTSDRKTCSSTVCQSAPAIPPIISPRGHK